MTTEQEACRKQNFLELAKEEEVAYWTTEPTR
jgi:hypothetical protein